MPFCKEQWHHAFLCAYPRRDITDTVMHTLLLAGQQLGLHSLLTLSFDVDRSLNLWIVSHMDSRSFTFLIVCFPKIIQITSEIMFLNCISSFLHFLMNTPCEGDLVFYKQMQILLTIFWLSGHSCLASFGLLLFLVFVPRALLYSPLTRLPIPSSDSSSVHALASANKSMLMTSLQSSLSPELQTLISIAS